jgi:hypothetical protein
MRRASVLAVLLLLLGCSGGDAGTSGASKRENPQITITGFSVDARIIRVQTEDVLVFEYPSQETTEEDLAALAHDGRSIGDVLLPWHKKKDDVHVFATGTQIAVYVGSTPGVLEALMSEGGEQVVGDPVPGGDR